MSDMTEPVSIRDPEAADLAAVATLNNGAVPAVNRLSTDDVARFLEIADVFRVVGPVSAPRGVMIALAPGRPYDSLNYRWFEERYDSFLYVDRIVVDPQTRSSGLGAALYRDLENIALERRVPRLACEVNLRPANERSVSFHERLGFAGVGTQDTEGGAKTVQLMIRDVPL